MQKERSNILLHRKILLDVTRVIRLRMFVCSIHTYNYNFSYVCNVHFILSPHIFPSILATYNFEVLWGFFTIFVQGFNSSNMLINGGIFWHSEEVKAVGKVWRVVIDVFYSDLDNFWSCYEIQKEWWVNKQILLFYLLLQDTYSTQSR